MKLKTLVVFSLMLLALVAGYWLKPHQAASSTQVTPGGLEALIPKKFGAWKADESQVAQVVSPDLQAQLNVLYSDTLSRVYVDSNGARIMLSLAYGVDQGRSLKVHKPEVCYIAQGFRVGETEKSSFNVRGKDINVMRLVATQDSRVEPITYWIRSGDDIVRGFVEQNISVIKAGLRGYIADGLLVRVSSIDQDRASAFAIHDRFLKDLVAETNPEGRKMLVGRALGE
jgi:EpsI family protein